MVVVVKMWEFYPVLIDDSEDGDDDGDGDDGDNNNGSNNDTYEGTYGVSGNQRGCSMSWDPNYYHIRSKL